MSVIQQSANLSVDVMMIKRGKLKYQATISLAVDKFSHVSLLRYDYFM